MLEEIRIRGLGVIDDATLELGAGFTVLTGETGAGKTMVLSALALLLGGRPDAGLVRPGHRNALVEGRVRVDPDGPVARRGLDAGADLEESALLLARTVSAEGRSRAHLGGRSVPAAVLAELADDLVAVHGQSDQRRLLRPAAQRAALDRFAGAGVGDLLARYTTGLRELRRVESRLEEVTTRSRERAQEADLLRFGLGEVATVDPRPGEDHRLVDEENRLAHADQLRGAADAARAALAGGDDPEPDDTDALSRVATARRALGQAARHDPVLAGLAERVGECAYLLADAAADLASYSADVDVDPARLASVQQRRAALAGLTRKYGATVDEVLDWASRAAVRVGELDGDEELTAGLRAAQAAGRERLGELAGLLSAARRAAAGRLAAAVATELTALAMPQARLAVELSTSDDPDGLVVGERTLAFGAAGVDEVEIRLAAHPGAPSLPLHRGASGGELSRVMLAVEVVLAGADPVPTFVFDEVDAGVGGAAAVEVGRRLARLAEAAQVIVVTHLPQVAAFAGTHLRVLKSDDGRVTTSGVRRLDEAGRVRELSRMLAGLEGSATAQAHAEELLASAASSRR